MIDSEFASTVISVSYAILDYGSYGSAMLRFAHEVALDQGVFTVASEAIVFLSGQAGAFWVSGCHFLERICMFDACIDS